MAIKAGTTLGSFEILALLGVGGMGEVYRARDCRLHREVAIKVLPESVAQDHDRLARFEREARTLASLDHPNIAALYDFQEASGNHFLVMQLIEGGTLADRLASGPLGPSEALSLFVDIADGLATAHECGIIHRDLKPANLKIDPRGRVKILDFGLAKAFETEAESNPTGTLAMSEPAHGKTSEGQILGTPAYMSPEQARGQAIDKRADIWAFGVCLYEALSGQRPFHGETATDLLADILRGEPDWTVLPPGLPRHLQLLIRRCLEKNSRRRFSSIGDIAITLEETAEDLRRAAAEAPTVPPRKPQISAPLAPGGFTHQAPVSPSPTPSASSPDAYSPRAFMPPTPTPSSQIARRIDRIVVLPFDNLMGDPNQEHFVDGMTESLSIELSKMTGVEVISHITAMHYKGTNKLPRQIARELGVDGLLGGAIMRGGEDIRITVRLIDGKTDRQVWADQYDGKHAQILSLQKQAALAVAEQVSTSLTLEDRMKTINVADVNPEAHNEYLLGRHFASRQSRESLQIAHKHYRKALALDPDFALAHAGMAEGFIAAGSYGVMRAGRAFSLARDHAIRATQLDGSLGFAYALQAHALMFIDQNWTESTRLVDQALQLSPRDPAVIEIHGHLQSLLGNHEEARKATEAACELNPLNALAWGQRARTHFLARDHEGALRYLEHSLALEPDLIHSLNARTYTLLALKRFDEAVATGEYVVRVYPDDLSGIANLPLVYAWAGRKADALQALKRIKHAHSTRALVYVALGDHETALDELETSLKEVDWPALISSVSPLWDPLRGYPRFRKVLQRLGYPDDIDQHLRPPRSASASLPSGVSPGHEPSSTSSEASAPNRLVVLPFENLMGDPNQEHFVDGMTEALSIELSKMTGVEVVSHTSAMHFKGTKTPHREIASQLGVGRLVAGSIMRAGDDIRITVRLIDGHTERQLWGDKYEGKHAGILSLQGEAALAVAEQVSSELTAEDRVNAINAPVVNPQAHEACLMGRHLELRRTRESLAMAREQFKNAIALDPGFVPAYAGLSKTWISTGVMGAARASKAFAEAHAFGLKAYELDPSAPEACLALGNAKIYAKHDWEAAERLIGQALQANPRFAQAYTARGSVMAITGRFSEAVRDHDRACALDPLNAVCWIDAAVAPYLARDSERALRLIERGLELEPTQISGLNTRIWNLLALDRNNEALTETERLLRLYPNDWSVKINAARVYARIGRTEEACEIAGKIPYESAAKAEVLIELNEFGEALNQLEGAAREFDWVLLTCGYGPTWDPIRRDPRFRAVRRKVGFLKDDDLDLLPPESSSPPSSSSATSAPAPFTETPSAPATANRIAVLPFDNLMGDPAQEHFVFGMADALCTELAKVRGFEVVSHNSSMLYKDTDKPPRRIAMELGVNRLLGGAVMRAGEDVRITIRLIDGRTEQQLWAEKYEGKQANILSLQAEAALAVAEQLASSISPQQRMRTLNAGSVKPEAHEAYLLGLHFAHHRNAEELLRALDQYRRAIELDPAYEPPYRELAQNMMVIGYLGGMNPHEAFAKCREYAESLRSLNAESPEARFLLGACRILIDKQWEEGMREVRAAARASPENVFLQRNLGVFEMVVGRIDDAQRALERACSLDPLAPANWTLRGMACHFDHRFEDALSFFRHARFVAPDYRHVYQQEIQLLTRFGRTAEARRLLDHLRSLSGNEATIAEAEALCLAAEGKASAAREVITRCEENHERAESIPFKGAHLFLALGDEETALARLEGTARVPGLWAMMTGYFPLFDPLRRHPRFRALRRSVGFNSDDDLDRLPPESKPASSSSVSARPDSTPSSGSGFDKIEKLAVLPFTSIAKDASDDWFVDGVTEALITELSKIEALGVISRSSAMQFKGTTQSAPQIAMELGVDAIVEGSVQHVGDDVRIQARLVDPRRDQQLWADAYDGKFGDILKLQKDVALSIARAVRANVSPSEARSIAAAPDVNAEAYEAYLRGMFYYHKQDHEALTRSQAYFERAIELAPEFARAYAFYAMAHITDGLLFVGMDASRQRVQEVLEQALTVDDREASVHTVMGWFALSSLHDWPRAERAFRRGVELNPGLSDAHNGMAWYYNSLGRFEAAIECERRAIELDPLNVSWRNWMGATYVYMERYEEGLKQLREALEIDPDHFVAIIVASQALAGLGRINEALEIVEQAIRKHGAISGLFTGYAYLLALSGRKAEARSALDEILNQREPEAVSSSNLALIAMALGDQDAALGYLEDSLKARGLSTFRLYHPEFKPLWGTPRFEAMLDRIDFPGVRPKRMSPPVAPETPSSSLDSVPASGLDPKISKLAVLPFSSIAKDDSEDWLVDGVTEALITELGKIRALDVVSRSSAMRFKNSELSAPEIARELQVDAVVEGSVQRVGDEIRIQAHLIDPRADRQLWGDDYDGQMKGILKLQKEVALSIAREVQATISPSEARRIRKVGEVKPEAYELFLRARHFYYKADVESLGKSRQLASRAVELDPDFAAGHAFFAQSCVGLGNLYGDLRDLTEAIGEAARRALELDPDDAMAHNVTAWNALLFEHDWKRAQREFHRVIELNPGLPEGYNGLAWYAFLLGRFEEAIQHRRKALQLDPLNPFWRVWLSWDYRQLGAFEDSLAEAREVLELDPGNFVIYSVLPLTLGALGRSEEALKLLDEAIARFGPDPLLLPPKCETLVSLGRMDEARDIAEELLARAREEHMQSTGIVRVLTAVGRLNEAVDWLERSIRTNAMSLFLIHHETTRSLASQPRVLALLDELGYPGLRPEVAEPTPTPSSESIPESSASTRSDSQPASDPGSGRYRKLAVLPFTSIAKDASEDWFTDGMTEVLITELGKIKSLTVISRTSAMRYKGTEKPMTEIAAELGVDALVEGSVIRMGDDVQITARLIDGKTDERLWGDFFAGKFEDILKLQGKVTLAIAREVRATVSPDDKARVEEASAVHSAAYEEYLRGRVLASEQNSRSFAKAITHLERAIELDPDFMPAHAELACCLSDMMGWRVGSMAELAPRSLAAAHRAKELSPDSARACAAMGMALRHTPGKRSEALAELLRAVELDGGNAEYRIRLVWELMPAGRFEEAWPHAERALELDPLSGLMWFTAATVRSLARRWEEAEHLYRKTLEFDPDYVPALSYLGFILVYQGRIAEALPLLKRAVERTEPDVPPAMLRNLGLGLNRSDDAEGARSMLDRLLAQLDSGKGESASAAALCLELGLRDEAYEWLGKAVEADDYSAQFIRMDAAFDPLREEPRFQALVAKLDASV